MNFFSLTAYCFFGLLSFFVIYILRSKYEISRLYNTIFSIFMFLVYASIIDYLKLDYMNTNLFIIFIFQFIFDFIYSTYLLEEDFFNKREANVLYYFLLIFLGLFLNNNYINKVDDVFLSGEDLRLIVWGFIIVFVYRFIKEENIFEKNYNTNKLLDEANIITMFTKLRRRYLDDIKVKDFSLELAVYSIMIFNNNKRNSLLRNIDNILFKINGHKRKLGIMQIESNTFINDIQSIDIVTNDLKKNIGKKTGSGVVESAVSKYMGEDNLEVLEIYNTLKNFFKI